MKNLIITEMTGKKVFFAGTCGAETGLTDDGGNKISGGDLCICAYAEASDSAGHAVLTTAVVRPAVLMNAGSGLRCRYYVLGCLGAAAYNGVKDMPFWSAVKAKDSSAYVPGEYLACTGAGAVSGSAAKHACSYTVGTASDYCIRIGDTLRRIIYAENDILWIASEDGHGAEECPPEKYMPASPHLPELVRM